VILILIRKKEKEMEEEKKQKTEMQCNAMQWCMQCKCCNITTRKWESQVMAWIPLAKFRGSFTTLLHSITLLHGECLILSLSWELRWDYRLLFVEYREVCVQSFGWNLFLSESFRPAGRPIAKAPGKQ
jgi:hypothetical protein